MNIEDIKNTISQYGNKDAFLAKLNKICAALRIDSDWLLMVMYNESHMNPRAIAQTAKKDKSVGIIQFMPATAAALGTSTSALLAMSNVQQLDYVYKYYKPYVGHMNSVADVYLVTFFPAALYQGDSYIFHTSKLSASIIAKQNPSFDLNKDGRITKAEFKEYIYSYFCTKYDYKKKTNLMPWVALLIGGGLAVLLWRKKKSKL